MARDRGSAAVALQPCEEQALRGHLESVAAGKKNLSDEQLVDLLLLFHPRTYSRLNRKLLTERVAKIIPLPCRREDAIDEPTPVSNKRRKIGEARIVNRQNEVSAYSSAEVDSSGSGGRINRAHFGDSGWWSDELGDGSREMNKNGWRGVSEKHNRPMFRDFWGMSSVIHELQRKVVAPLYQFKLLRHLGVEPATRILLHGPPRCGKTTLARAVANEARLQLLEVSAARLVSEVSGAAEETIRQLFSTAYMRAPSIVLIDDIDAISSITDSLHKEIEHRIVNQLMACMEEPCGLIKPVDCDAGSESSNSRPGYVLVIGATNRPDALDTALRRLFDLEIALGAPDRLDILSALTRNLKLEAGFDPAKLARCTIGFVAQDLVALAKKAGLIAVDRITGKRISEYYKEHKAGVQLEDCYMQPLYDEELENLSITMEDFLEAAKMVCPSSILEGFSTTPDANWDDVGGLQLLKLEFERHIVKRIKFPEVYEDLGLHTPTTFFLFGSFGCGKTLIVKALANEAGANFLHIKGPTLSKYGDQIELVVHIIFNYAMAHRPCILFFDELEAMIPGGDEGRLRDFVKLVLELNGHRDLGIYVIVATNRPEVVSQLTLDCIEIFEKILHAPLPSPVERGAILKVLARNKPIGAHVDLMALGKDVACENFSGADLSRLMMEAVKAAIDRQTLMGGGRRVPLTIKYADFNRAFAKVSPSVSSMEVKKWEHVPAECEADLDWE